MKLKKLTDSQKAQIWEEIDGQGLDYWVQNYGSEYKNTELGPLLISLKNDLDTLESIVQGFEEYVGSDDMDDEDENE